MAMPGKFKAKKRKGKKKAPFSIWTVLGWFCITSNEPIKNEISDTELVFWFFVLYLMCGSVYYFFSSPFRASLTFADTLYFLVSTMTTVGYGDIVPPTDPAARLWTLFFVVWGLVVTLAGLNELAAYVLEMRERIMESMRAAVLSGASSKASTDVSNPMAGSGVDADVAERLQRRSQTRLASFEAFETELAQQGVSGWRAHAAFAAHLPALARKRFPVIDIVLWLGGYCAFWGWLYSSVEGDGMTFVDAMYLAMVTGTTVGYGDVSPQTVAGRWLAIAFLPFAVVFVGTQMGAIGDLFTGSAAEGALDKLMGLDLSVESLLDMDDNGDGTITEFEFLKYMLVKADLVDPGILDSLHSRFQSMDEDNSGVLTADDLPTVEPLGCPTARHAAAVPKASFAKAAREWKLALADCKAQLPKPELLALQAATREAAARPPARRRSSGSPAGKKKKKKTVSHDDDNARAPPPVFDATPDLGLIRVRVKGSPQERGRKVPPRASREEASLLTGGAGGGPSENEKRVAASVAERRSRTSGDLQLAAAAASGTPRGKAAPLGGSRDRTHTTHTTRPGASVHDSPVAGRKKSTTTAALRNPLEAGRLASVDGSPPTSAGSASDASVASARPATRPPNKKPPPPRHPGNLAVQRQSKDGKDGPQLL